MEQFFPSRPPHHHPKSLDPSLHESPLRHQFLSLHLPLQVGIPKEAGELPLDDPGEPDQYALIVKAMDRKHTLDLRMAKPATYIDVQRTINSFVFICSYSLSSICVKSQLHRVVTTNEPHYLCSPPFSSCIGVIRLRLSRSRCLS